MLHQTHGIVIRTVKYGETSVVASIFTELFGLQPYMVNGVRTSKKTASIAAPYLQPGNLLELVVYHHDRTSLQRIKEAKPLVHFDHLFQDVKKNAVMLFMIELLQKCLKQPDPQPELFYFMEDVMKALDRSTPLQAANIPLFFTLHLSHFFGFRIMDNFSRERNILDLHEGQFVVDVPPHPLSLNAQHSECVAQLLRVMQVEELQEIPLTRPMRNSLLDSCLEFYALHIHPFGSMRSLSVLRTVLEE